MSFYIAKALSFAPVRLVPPFRSGKLLAIGTILNALENSDIVWGSGARSYDSINQRENVNICAIRGPLTRRALLNAGIQLPVGFSRYFDPAILFPLIQSILHPQCEPYSDPQEQILVIPHYNEYNMMMNEFRKDHPPGFKLIHPFLHPEVIAYEIMTSSRVLSSSLHGIILADAYSVPVHPFVSSESSFKYLDYYEGTGRSVSSFKSSWREALDASPPASPSFSSVYLRRCLSTYPFQLALPFRKLIMTPHKVS